MKKRLFIIIFLTIIGLGIIDYHFKPKVKLWVYEDLPNNYIIEKKSETKMIVGKKDKDKIVIKREDKEIGLEKYIAEFSYSNNYITLKCASTNKETNSIDVEFYIIDSKNEDIYGPYNLESTYLEVKEKIVTEELSDWIKTIELES